MCLWCGQPLTEWQYRDLITGCQEDNNHKSISRAVVWTHENRAFVRQSYHLKFLSRKPSLCCCVSTAFFQKQNDLILSLWEASLITSRVVSCHTRGRGDNIVIRHRHTNWSSTIVGLVSCDWIYMTCYLIHGQWTPRVGCLLLSFILPGEVEVEWCSNVSSKARSRRNEGAVVRKCCGIFPWGERWMGLWCHIVWEGCDTVTLPCDAWQRLRDRLVTHRCGHSSKLCHRSMFYDIGKMKKTSTTYFQCYIVIVRHCHPTHARNLYILII